MRRWTAACGRSSATRAPRRSRRRSSWRSGYTKRHNVIAFLGAFHGRTMGSLSLTASKAAPAEGLRADACRACITRPTRTVTAVRSDSRPRRCAAECLDFIEQQLFVHLVSPDEVAAIVVEPIQGEGGYVVPPPVFHQRLRELATDARHPAHRGRSAVRHGPHREDVRDRALRRGAGHRRHREGDRVGHAARRVRGARRGDVVAAGAHASTFGGNPVSCAAALATIGLLKRRADAERGRRGRAHDGRAARR